MWLHSIVFFVKWLLVSTCQCYCHISYTLNWPLCRSRLIFSSSLCHYVSSWFCMIYQNAKVVILVVWYSETWSYRVMHVMHNSIHFLFGTWYESIACQIELNHALGTACCAILIIFVLKGFLTKKMLRQNNLVFFLSIIVVKFVSIASQDYAFDLLEWFCSKMANIHNVFYFTLFL